MQDVLNLNKKWTNKYGTITIESFGKCKKNSGQMYSCYNFVVPVAYRKKSENSDINIV